MSIRADRTYINLPVKNLKKSVDFFTKVGFEFDANFTDENATCMVINDHTFIMLLVEGFFKTFTKKQISDSAKNTEVIVALSAESRDKVDEIVNKALAAGGKTSNEPIDHGFMYGWSFEDIDGHLWEVVYTAENGE
ncbi:VOC family protein [Cytobacillus horneckiae]|uniref:VOC family protein n=1 Tax=Cytobacillus horneckiae TaxID=549687 RepID=UPI00399FD38F